MTLDGFAISFTIVQAEDGFYVDEVSGSRGWGGVLIGPIPSRAQAEAVVAERKQELSATVQRISNGMLNVVGMIR